MVVDVGAGSGRFADLLEVGPRYPRLRLPDGNEGTVAQLVDRYQALRPRSDEGRGSHFATVDLLIQGVKKLLGWKGLRHQVRDGYTLVLRKGG